MEHRSARLSVYSRQLLVERVEGGWNIAAAAAAAGVSRQTGSKWVGRFRSLGVMGLENRSSRPHRIRTSSPRVVASVVIARVRDRLGTHRLAWALGMARSTVYAILRRLHLNRFSYFTPKEPIVRYEWPEPGDMIHVDTKKLGRVQPKGSKRFGGPHHGKGLGWNFVHVAVDDHSRLAYAEELADEHPVTTVQFLNRALAFYASHGISVRRVLSGNGNNYKSFVFRDAITELGIRHSRIRPYRPQTNGKAEAFVKILINGWAYVRPYPTAEARVEALERFVDTYNHRRPHGGLDGATPISRVRQ